MISNTSYGKLTNRLARHRQAIFEPARNTSAETAMLNALGLGGNSLLRYICANYGYVLGASGHIRLFGGKNDACMSFFEANQLEAGHPGFEGILLIASTSEGGLFALNCGEMTGADFGEILFLPVRSLCWERLGIGYRAFVDWAIDVSKYDLTANGWLEPTPKGVTLAQQDCLANAKLRVLAFITERGNDRYGN